MADKKKKSIPAIIFAILAILGGLNAFFVAGMRGHSAGWELMAIYCAPPILFSIIAIAIRRGILTYIGLLFGIIAIVSFFLGA